MRVILCYVHPTSQWQTYGPMARRFVQSYMENPPGETDHEIHVAINGSIEIGDWCRNLFDPLPARFFQHNNYGKDIGAYQHAADILECDMMVCLGAPVHFHKAGWLDRMTGAFLDNGPAMYGCWGFQFPLPHLRTTCFWCPPELLLGYPRKVSDGERYGFEHGVDSMCLWSRKLGFEPLMVTWRGTYRLEDWSPITKEESLVVDQHMTRNEQIELANKRPLTRFGK